MSILQKILGILYLAAGIAKAFPSIENIGETLALAAKANEGSMVEGLSLSLANNSGLVSFIIGVIFVVSGLMLITNKGPVKKALGLQLFLIIGFVTILHRAFPGIWVADGLFFIAGLALLRHHAQPKDLDKITTTSRNWETVGDRTDVQDEFAEEYDAVVVGGGGSGLTAALKLKDKKVLVLERHALFGGNARYEIENGLRHPTAGVCFKDPIEGTEMADLLKEVGLWEKWRVTGTDMVVVFDTKLLMSCLHEILIAVFKQPKELLNPKLWGLTLNLFGSAIVGQRYILAEKKLGDPIFAELYEFLDNFTPYGGKFPEMPWRENCQWTREEMEMLDEISLYTYLFEPEKLNHIPANLKPAKKFGRLVHDAVDTTLRVECLSLKQVSAYVGLHFLMGYLRGVLVTLPGGNGAISRAIQDKLTDYDNIQLAAECEVTQVHSTDDEATVTFKQAGKTVTVRSAAVIWAAPKHKAADIIECLPDTQKEKIKQVEHHDYCVANIYIKQPVFDQYFGGYVIEPYQATRDLEWVKGGICMIPNWLDPTFSKDYGIVTMLKPIASDDDQGKLSDDLAEQIRTQAATEMATIMNTVDIPATQIEDVKVWRWPGALCVAKVGQCKDNTIADASMPYKRIAFANQDSVGIGNFESGVYSAFRAAEYVQTLSPMKSTKAEPQPA